LATENTEFTERNQGLAGEAHFTRRVKCPPAEKLFYLCVLCDLCGLK